MDADDYLGLVDEFRKEQKENPEFAAYVEAGQRTMAVAFVQDQIARKIAEGMRLCPECGSSRIAEYDLPANRGQRLRYKLCEMCEYRFDVELDR